MRLTVSLCVLAFIGLTESALALDPALKCESSELKTSGKYGFLSAVLALATAVVGIALGIHAAHATDQGITGKKLLMRSGKLVLLSKDPSISITGSDPVGGSDSSITFDDGSGPVTWNLPKALWSANGSGTLFKYKNASAPAAPSAVKIAKVKAGKLKVVAKDVPFAVPNGAAMVDVVLSLDGGTNTYCMTFTGTGDGSKFLVKDAAAGSCTPKVACTASGYPACGGGCPSGEVCQAHEVDSCGSGPCLCLTDTTDCICVPDSGMCAGSHGLSSGGGGCVPPGDVPFTYGPCPPGSACVDASDIITGEGIRDCAVIP